MKFYETYTDCTDDIFTKLDDKGNKLPISAKRKDQARVVYDSNTGLYWEMKSENKDDINYAMDTYNYDDAKDLYIDKLNSNNYGGFNDWRLPNKDELRSILDYNYTDIAINIDIFENCKIADYWTKNTYNLQPYFAWVIYLGFGSGIAKSMESDRYVMAVRGGYDRRFGENTEDRFLDNGDGTITDLATNLMWQKGENERTDYFDAKKQCKELDLAGYKDWRLPNIKELNTILNLDYEDGWWYFKKYFPADGLNPPLLHYLSSSSFKNHYAWVTNFCFGYDGYYAGKDAPLLFRAVREIDKEESRENSFVVTHTGEDYVVDVYGVETSDSKYTGLDATRITTPMSYTTYIEDNIVIDNNTGLYWDISNEDKYVTWDQARLEVDKLNEACFGGYRDWRLPEREELRSIVSYTDEIPSINIVYFKNAKPELYWTNQVYKNEIDTAWGIYFGYGCAINYTKSTRAKFRAVRGKKISFGKERFIVNEDKTVKDSLTNLMWMQEETPLLTLTEALEYCKNLELGGYKDWQLPNMKELASLINLEEGNMWYFEDIFPNTNIAPQGFYMVSTTFDKTFGWGCNFQFGFDGYYADRRGGKYPFRPVRKC